MHIGSVRPHTSASFQPRFSFGTHPLGRLFIGALALLGAVLVAPLVPATAQAQPPAKLLFQSVSVTGNSQEYIAIHNPTAQAVDLSNYYLTDAIFPGQSYGYITDPANRLPGKAGGGLFGDFHMRFPAGASIAAGDTIAVAHTGAGVFRTTWGRRPAFEAVDSRTNDSEVPDMRPAFQGSLPDTVTLNGLSNNGESITLYYWDQQSDLVIDVDYVCWGPGTDGADARFRNVKTGISVDGPDADTTPSTYRTDTPATSQNGIAAGAHAPGSAFRRENFSEGTQTMTGGNGIGGRDETSENLATTWSSTNPAVPPFVKGAVAPAELTARPGGPYSGTVAQAIAMSGSASIAKAGETITGYSWNFGDGSAAGNGVTTSHTYATAGTFTVTLTVTGSGGGTHSASTTAVVSPPGQPGNAKKLLFQAVSVTGNNQEYVAIFNPTTAAVDLSNYYLSDAVFTNEVYAYIVDPASRTPEKAGGGTFNDFHVRFPAGATLAAGDTLAIAIRGARGFIEAFGRKPAYELSYVDSEDSTVPNMLEAFNGSVPDSSTITGLTNSAESISLYYWDGQTDLVTDIDYLCWGPGATSDLRFRVDKTGLSLDGPDADTAPTAYRADTPTSSQVAVASTGHSPGNCFRRENFSEGTQKTTGGNGVGGSDETSENLATTFSSTNLAVPPFVKSGGPNPGTLAAVPGGPYTGGVNDVITFDGSRSTAPTGGSIASYAWNFGDGGSGSGQRPTHAYAAVGTYTVTLTVTSNTGATNAATTTATITTVAPPPSSTGFLQVKARTFLPTLRETFPITIDVPSGFATLRIFDLQGREIRVLFDGEASGKKTYNWDGHDDQLMLVAAGTYLCNLEVRDRNGHFRNYQAPIVVARRLERN